MTPLDRAHARMIADPDGDAARTAYALAFRVVDLTLALRAEAGEGTVEPLVLETEAGPTALAFDSDARLAAVLDPGPVATLPGRDLARLLAEADLALLINADTPSAWLWPTEALGWMAELQTEEAGDWAQIAALAPPQPPEGVLPALDQVLAGAGRAYLAEAAYAGGGSGLVLALPDLAEAQRAEIGQAVRRALAAAGFGDLRLDVIHPPNDHPLTERFAALGMTRTVRAVQPAPPKLR
ncbi:MAG: SseB family protein [Pseudomonadota bacterium]